MRRGSALLMVLGMVAFLVISAVAFSAYMRNARLPSSFFLRTSSSRDLVKAALAEAIQEIEASVADNPHPGVGGEAQQANIQNDDNEIQNKNRWFGGRVLRGSEEELVDPALTVPTLNLEALAYLPPPLINLVRYYSRRVESAVWRDFDFDAGRYAFTVVDVSDYFDVNRVRAAPKDAVGRSSADNGRVTLAYLFENENHTGFRVKPDEWESFMANYGLGSQSKSIVPIVSWADLNLALWADQPAGMTSPWCRVVDYSGGASETDFVKDDAEDRHAISNMVFVTDSWYPAAKSDPKAVSLADQANQPFRPAAKLSEDDSYKKRGFEMILQNVGTPANYNWTDVLSPPEIVQLCDYLDADSIPSSLALPSFERAPMVSGVSLGVSGMRVMVKAENPYETPEFTQNGTKYRYHVEPHVLQVTVDQIFANVGLVYPFKHKRPASGKWNVQAFATVTFVAGGGGRLRLPKTSEWAMKPDWALGEKKVDKGVFKADNADSLPSGFVLCSEKKSVNEPTVETVDDAILRDEQLEFGNVGMRKIVSKLSATYNGINGLHEDECTLRVIRKQEAILNDEGKVVGWKDVEGEDPIRQFGALPANDDLNKAVTPEAGKEYVPTIQVWVRVTDENKSSAPVDLVPASWEDDIQPCEIIGDAAGSRPQPALRFSDGSGTAKVVYDGKTLTANGELVVAPQAYMTSDPRFNYAPENFWKLNAFKGDFKAAWKDKVEPIARTRDGDILMATSDAGYLQSLYELAFLTPIATGASDDWGCLTGGAYNGAAKDEDATLAADNAMWNTFRSYRRGNLAPDAIFDDAEFVNGGTRGQRICPYTPDTAIMMGALANTPFDWWAAGTNVTTAKSGMLKNIQTALQYTFSRHSPETPVEWEYLEDLANDFIDGFRGAANGNWKTVYDGFNWRGSNAEGADAPGGLTFLDALADNSGITLHSVDRKFLHGFWKECFANRQQLYLVFVRAEPEMMGGGAIGKTPPTLGGRAVALVWRNPVRTTSGAPHQTRVLFYRQFE